MSSMLKLAILLLIITITCHVTNCKVYKVGGSLGWTNVGNPDYKSWAASMKFQVDDTIVFNYNKQFHNVVRVTHKNYNSCNATSSPYPTWASGNDSFTIRNPGHFYFICSVPGHCQNGQKVDIRIPKFHTLGPEPSPMPSGPSPSSPKSVDPSAFGPSSAMPPSHHHHSGSFTTYPTWKPLTLLVFSIIGVAY